MSKMQEKSENEKFMSMRLDSEIFSIENVRVKTSFLATFMLTVSILVFHFGNLVP